MIKADGGGGGVPQDIPLLRLLLWLWFVVVNGWKALALPFFVVVVVVVMACDCDCQRAALYEDNILCSIHAAATRVVVVVQQ